MRLFKSFTVINLPQTNTVDIKCKENNNQQVPYMRALVNSKSMGAM